MNKRILYLMISFAVILNFSFIASVKAEYGENIFTNGKCIEVEQWKDYATTGYSLNQTTGIYELTGDKYSEENAASTHIYYMTSPDGRILVAFVPNYDASMQNETIKQEIFDKGIDTTKNCSGTYAAMKTLIGNPPTKDSIVAGIFDVIDVGDNSENQNGTDPNQTEQPSQNQTKTPTENPNENGSNEVVEKIESPNTASPAAITAIIASIVLVVVAGYAYLSKAKPELFKKNK